MSETAAPDEAKPKRSRLPLLIGLVLVPVLGAGGFYATWSGLILAPHAEAPTGSAAVAPLADIAFVPVDPVVVALGPAADSRHLRMTAQLEVSSPHAGEVTLLLPRILDVLNSYLRAIPVSEIEDPTALTRIRAQLLRRIQIVTGEGRVRDLLVTEFILN